MPINTSYKGLHITVFMTLAGGSQGHNRFHLNEGWTHLLGKPAHHLCIRSVYWERRGISHFMYNRPCGYYVLAQSSSLHSCRRVICQMFSARLYKMENWTNNWVYCLRPQSLLNGSILQTYGLILYLYMVISYGATQGVFSHGLMGGKNDGTHHHMLYYSYSQRLHTVTECQCVHNMGP